ncbi:MAG TPA: YdcF family protein [Thermomicrobiaceae bacterium]|nr:YdcF family protein [Thermomicrobiaceae bacterium]
MAPSSGTTATLPRVQIKRRRSTAATIFRVLLGFAVAIVVAIIIIICWLGIAIYSQARHDETAPADAILVMGTAQYDGRPSPVLQARLDHALQLYQEHYAPVIVLTGGKAPGDVYSEAQAGYDYLEAHGVPASALIAVPDGRTSYTSIEAASKVLIAHSDRKVLMVSDAFHEFRIKHMASDLGLKPLASPTHTSPIKNGSWLEKKYMIREIGAYIDYVLFKG